MMLTDDGQRVDRSRSMILLSMRFHCLLLLFTLPFLLGAKSREGEEQVICWNGFLEIVSPDTLSEDECEQVGKMAMAAWNFDLMQMRWSSSIDMQKPLKFQLISVEEMKSKHPGVLGYAIAPGDEFVASTRVLDDPFANGTLAHELGHIQSFRALGLSSKNNLKVPHYFLEGHGLSMGRAYRDHLGLTKHKYDVDMAKTIGRLTASEARRILTTDRDYYVRGGKRNPKMNHQMEAMGIFFVEYLRVRKDMSDSFVRMGRVFELVGRGKTYEQAFKQGYGISIDEAISDITDFIARTQSTPGERLKGTYYEGLL